MAMDFSAALIEIKSGHKLSRKGWNGPNQYVCLQRPDKFSKMTLPYVYIRNAQQELVPWLVSQGDLLADDWVVV